MHRTQIYLQDELYAALKSKAGSMGISLSELIRRTLEKDANATSPQHNAAAFFERLQPLQSYAGVEPLAHVRALRGTSRLLREATPSTHATPDAESQP